MIFPTLLTFITFASTNTSWQPIGQSAILLHTHIAQVQHGSVYWQRYLTIPTVILVTCEQLNIHALDDKKGKHVLKRMYLLYHHHWICYSSVRLVNFIMHNQVTRKSYITSNCLDVQHSSAITPAWLSLIPSATCRTSIQQSRHQEKQHKNQ